MDDSEYEVRDFSKTAEMLKFIYDKDTKEKICALQFTISVYFENLQRELEKKADMQKVVKFVKK